jgi:hypothetical protein
MSVTVWFNILTGSRHNVHDMSRISSCEYTGTLTAVDDDTWHTMFQRYYDDGGDGAYFEGSWRIIFAGRILMWSEPIAANVLNQRINLVRPIGHWSTNNAPKDSPLVIMPKVGWKERK